MYNNIMKKTSVILDCDVTNNIDDRFAIVYAFACRDNLDIKAVTIEPFKSKKKDISIEEMQLDSKFESNRLLSLMGVFSNDYVFEGSAGYLSGGYDAVSPAVKKMASEIKKSKEKLVIIATGALTNIAILLKHNKSLVSKVHVVWLGTGNLLLDKFEDQNYRSDKKAFEIVTKSGVEFTIIPNFVARQMVSSVYEMEHNMSSTHIGRYLVDCAKNFAQEKEDYGVKTIFDVVPVGYVLHQNYFKMKDISVNEVLKDESKLKNPHLVHYVYDLSPNAGLWRDFIDKINAIDVSPFSEKIFFISDTHFSQDSKVKRKLVPFASADDADREMIRRWNQVVSKNDIVYHLGDFGDYEKIKELNGRVILICGNYEELDYANDFESFKQKLLDLGFFDVHKHGIYLDESVLGEKVFLTHKPLSHAKNGFTIFGHVHTLAPVKSFGFNVCVTYHNFAPVSAGQARRYLNFVKGCTDKEVFS